MNDQNIISEIPPALLLKDLNDFEIDENNNWFIKTTKHQVYIKSVDNSNPNKIAALAKEFRILYELSNSIFQIPVGFYHPNDANDYHFITLYLKNQSLSEFMTKEEFLDMDVHKYLILVGIVFGMNILHSQNIIHGHLCPSHILLNDNGEPILFHFNIPRDINSENNNLEEFLYLAPEIINEGNYTKKSDVYAFGLIANQIYSEEKIFSGLSKEEIIRIKTNDEVQISSNVPDAIYDIIRQCLSNDPNSRPSFQDVLSVFRNNVFQIESNLPILQYLSQISNQNKNKITFKIPRQLIKLPNDHTVQWSEKTTNPIDFDVFTKVFRPFNGKKALIIMTIGELQKGKTTFLREITRNLAYHAGKGMVTQTLGIHIDGPYRKSDLINNIFIRNFKEKFDSLQITDDVEIFFMDSQGIGDDQYDKFRLILDRIYPIFTAVSTICISICMASPLDSIKTVFKIIRKIRLMEVNKFTHSVLLIRDYGPFNRLRDYKFPILSNFCESFREEYEKSNPMLNFYLSDYLTVLPIASTESNYEFYLCSIWYAMYHIFSMIDEDTLLPKINVINLLKNLSEPLFSRDYYLMKKFVMEKKKLKMIKKKKNTKSKKVPTQKQTKDSQQENEDSAPDDNNRQDFLEETNNKQEITSQNIPFQTLNDISRENFEEEEESFEDIVFSNKQKLQMNSIEQYFSDSHSNYAEILKYCILTSYYIASNVSFILSQSKNIVANLDNLMNALKLIINNSIKIILPLFIGEFDINANDFYQYSNEMLKDVNSFLAQNNKKWLDHMKNEKNAAIADLAISATTLVTAPLYAIPIARETLLGITYGVHVGFWLYNHIQKRIRNFIINDAFKSSLFPYIWNHQMKKVTGKVYDLNNIKNSRKSIGNENEQLIIFFEQNEENNDSTLLFRSLTGFDVNFKDQKTVSMLFSNVSIENMIERLKRGKKIHKSNLRNKEIKKVNILYLKGYSKVQITEFCLYQNRKPILVSSILEGQNVSIYPGCQYIFNLFVISLNSYEYSTVNKDDYITNITKAKNIVLEIAPDNKKINLLPVYSKNYDFIGPVADSLIKYGCRLILQDTIFDAFLDYH